MIALLATLACSSSKSLDSAQDTAASSDTSDTTDPNDTGDTGGFPANPSPFTIEVSGVANQSLIFDEPSCLKPAGSSNLRIFWRNSQDQHVFVLKIEMLGTYTGVGSYDSTTARATLQEEAGGSGLYFTADSTAGDTVDVVIEGDEDSTIWGSATIPSLRDTTGAAINLAPSTLPVWCPEVTE